MKLLHPSELLSCGDYEGNQNPQIEIFEKPAGEVTEHLISGTELVIMTQGSFRLSYGKLIRETISERKIMFFAPGSHFQTEAVEDFRCFIFRMKGLAQFCECVYQDYLNDKSDDVPEGFYMLPTNNRVDKYIELLEECMTDGFKSTSYFKIKIAELLFLLQAYYAREQLTKLFSPFLSENIRFILLMYEHSPKARTVKDLADIAHYSLSGFKKQFSRIFGIPPSEWLASQKADQIFYDLNISDISIKDLADKYNFSSPSSLSKFCQEQFGMPPGKIKLNSGKKD